MTPRIETQYVVRGNHSDEDRYFDTEEAASNYVDAVNLVTEVMGTPSVVVIAFVLKLLTTHVIYPRLIPPEEQA